MSNPSIEKRKKVTTHMLFEKKAKKEKITFLTAYDYQTATLEDEAGIDLILVGDSLGMCVYGFDSTLPVTLDIMINHTRAVRKGAPNSFVIGDMPYMTYQVSVEKAVENAGRLMQETGADGVKLEGGLEMCETVRRITSIGIPVMGHIGLTPQSASSLGGFKAQGRQAESALRLIKEAKGLEAAGCFSILLEAMPAEVAQIITENAKIPILGIGAGPYCDGQVLVVNDLLGFFAGHKAKFVKQYADLNHVIEDALLKYKKDVEQVKFPEEKHCYKIEPEELAKLKEALE